MKSDYIDPLSDIEKRLQAALKQEAAFWQGREPDRLAMACRVTGYRRRPALLRVVWAGSMAVAAAAALAIILRPGESDVFTDPADAPAVILVLTDTSTLHAGLPRFSSLHFSLDQAR